MDALSTTGNGWARCVATLVVVSTAACRPATTPPLLSPAPSPTPRLVEGAAARTHARKAVVAEARKLLGGPPYVVGDWTFDADPVGFVRAAYWAAGIELVDSGLAAQNPEADGVQLLFRSASDRHELHRHRPDPGDLAFFDATPASQALYPTQVAIVESVDAQGTVTVVGQFARGPGRVRFNLRQPERETGDDGARLNDRLRGEREVAAAKLFRSFADPFAP